MTEVVSGVVPEDWPSSKVSIDLKLSGQTIKYYGGITSETSAKYRLSSHTGKLQDKAFLIRNLRNKYLREPENLALEKQVVKQEEALKLHSRLEEMEKRIRQLEIKSVQTLQETAEEAPQSPHVVH
jgi:hypothetical protein